MAEVDTIAVDQLSLLNKVSPDVFSTRIHRASLESLDHLKSIDKYCENFKRKDFTGKLKELLATKTFTYPFILKKKKNPNYLELQTLSDRNIVFPCFIPTELEAALQNKDFFVEGDIYLFADLSMAVAKNPTPSVFFFINTLTKGSRL